MELSKFLETEKCGTTGPERQQATLAHFYETSPTLSGGPALSI